MTTDTQILIAKRILDSNLVKKVFHSVVLVKDENNQTIEPSYPKGAEWTYAGIDDSQGLFAYIRTNGDMIGNAFKLGSCEKSYTMTAPLRVVFFNDNEDRNQEDLILKLSKFTFLKNVILTRIITDKFRLVKEESPIFREKFDGRTFYVAFDVNVTFIHLPTNCETDECIIYPNPILPCLAVVPQSSGSATS